MTSCTIPDFPQKAEIRVFRCSESTYRTASGWWFLAIGSYQSDDKTIRIVKFYCKNNKEEYCLFEAMPSTVKISLDSTITRPYASFSTNFSDLGCMQRSLKAGYPGNYVTIHCNPKDFPENINISEL